MITRVIITALRSFLRYSSVKNYAPIREYFFILNCGLGSVKHKHIQALECWLNLLPILATVALESVKPSARWIRGASFQLDDICSQPGLIVAGFHP